MARAAPSIVVVNDLSGVKTQIRTRGGTGKASTSLAIRGEPIAVNLDEKELARAGAAAMAETMREQVRAIQQDASTGSQSKRQTQSNAYQAGAAWALRQFSGGRMGPMPPNQTRKLFNNSGRLAAGIVAAWSQSEAAWIIRFPANRFAPEFLAKSGGQAVLDHLVSLVPALRYPMQPAVVDAIKRTRESMLFIQRGKLGDARRAAEMARLKLGADVLRFAQSVLAA